jgi:hypothetical protein
MDVLEEVKVTARVIEPNTLAAMLAARPAGVLADRIADVERVTRAPTVQPSQPAANKPPIPEVVVRAPRIMQLFQRYSMWASIYYLTQNRPPDDLVNQALEMLQRQVDEDQALNDAMNARTAAQRDPRINETEIADIPETTEFPVPGLEEVIVVAPRINRVSRALEITFPPGMDTGLDPWTRPDWMPDLGEVIVPVPEPLVQPRTNPWQDVPRETPEWVPNSRPEKDPGILIPFPGSGGLTPPTSAEIKPTPQGGLAISFKQQIRPETMNWQKGKRPQENRKRKDRKSKQASAAIRALYSLINKTYGTYTELEDLYEVITQNIKIEFAGGLISWDLNDIGAPGSDDILRYRFSTRLEAQIYHLQMAYKYGEVVVDWEQLAYDYFLMQVIDSTIGLANMLYGKTASEHGWHIDRNSFDVERVERNLEWLRENFED